MDNFIVVKIITLILVVMFQLNVIWYGCIQPYKDGTIPLWLSLILTFVMIFSFVAAFLFANEIANIFLYLLKIG